MPTNIGFIVDQLTFSGISEVHLFSDIVRLLIIEMLKQTQNSMSVQHSNLLDEKKRDCKQMHRDSSYKNHTV